MISVHSRYSFNWALLFTLLCFIFQPVSLAGGGRGIAVTAKGGKGKNVVRPYDPNESNGSWSVVLVVILPVAQMFVVVVICVITHHFYMKYCKSPLCCCFCCRRQKNTNHANDTRTSHTTTVSAAGRVIASDTDSGDTCAVPMTEMGASVWHSSVNSLSVNGIAPTAASTQTSNFKSKGPRQIYKHSVRPTTDTVINCDLIERHALDARETVNRSCFSREAHRTSNAKSTNTGAGTSNQRAVGDSGNGVHYKNNPTLPQVIYCPNEVSCVVQCHLPPSSPPLILSSPAPSALASTAYQSNQMKYPVSQSFFSHQQQRPVLMHSGALPCTSGKSTYCDCDGIDASDELENYRGPAVSLNGNLEEEAELPEIKELFYSYNPHCAVHNLQHKEPRSVSANSKSPYFASNHKTKRFPNSR